MDYKRKFDPKQKVKRFMNQVNQTHTRTHTLACNSAPFFYLPNPPDKNSGLLVIASTVMVRLPSMYPDSVFIS